jgi:hypothetical protein
MAAPLSESEERQARIADWLDEKRRDLASMYRVACALLDEPSKAGDERTRVAHICHSMREVMNRLPAALGVAGPNDGVPRGTTVLQGLPTIAARFPGVDLSQEIENVPVPRELAVALGNLIRAAIADDGRIAANAAALLTDDGNTKHPAVQEWRELIRFFVQWAHLEDEQRSHGDLPSDDQLRIQLDRVEILIDSLRAEFFVSLHSIEDILAGANSQLETGGEP